MQSLHGTTILLVRRGNKIVIGGDGQITLGNVLILKSNACKVHRLFKYPILVGFAGAVADAITLLERFEAKLAQYLGQLKRSREIVEKSLKITSDLCIFTSRCLTIEEREYV